MRNWDELLKKYISEDVPETGLGELTETDAPSWKIAECGNDPALPGGGLLRYPMLYIGEGCNKMFIVADGKIIWTYSTGKGWEYDDIWMLSDGNILFSRMSWVGEVTPKKELVWRYQCPEGTEIHSVQPIGENKIMMLQNGTPPKIIMVDRKSREILWEKAVPCDPAVKVHGQFRRGRYTSAGTYLLSHLSEGKVAEYDENMKEIWRYEVKGPWAAVRLKNGNTLITAEKEDRTIEVNRDKKIVWELSLDGLPPEYRLRGSQSCVRLANGNTIICSRGDGGKAPQLVEVTPDKQVVWCVNDWKNLGPATAVQILNEPETPEIPCDCGR